jgi:UDP-glucose 4-epimerase
MEKVLITGGAGFIGSNLSKRLLKEGYEVYVIDDLSTGSLDNIQDIRDNSNFHFTNDTILNNEVLIELVKQVDIIFHLAAVVGVKLIMEEPIKSMNINIGGTEAVLKLANKYSKKVFIASTSEVYGKSEQFPLNEKGDAVIGSTYITRWNYSYSKALDEFLALAYYRKYGLKVIILRFFNTIGVGQTGTYGMVVPTLIQQALKNEPLTVYGDGKQSRCFCDVEDVINGLLLLNKSDKAYGEIFNIGSEEEITLIGLAEKIKTLTDSKSEIKFVSYEEAYGPGYEDIRRRVPDLAKINGLVFYQPSVSLDGSIKKIICSFKE